MTALEFALLAPALILLMFGTMEFGRALYTRSSLQFVVEQAARCAALNKTQCGSTAGVQTYAASRVPGLNVPSTSFSVATAGCGKQVTASQDVTLMLPQPLAATITLRASSCYPT